MNERSIKTLQAVREYPAVSIFLPISHQSPNEIQQAPIRVKNLLRETEVRLLREFSEEEIAPLRRRWKKLAATIDYQKAAKGLALFISQGTAQVFYLPFPVRERVVVDDTFATRDLVSALLDTPRYRVLVLNRELARLYEGTRDKLAEINDGVFPLPRKQPGVEVEWTESVPPGSPHGGVDPDQYKVRLEREFLQRVDNALEKIMAKSPRPLAVVGVEHNIGMFKTVSRHTDHVIAQLSHSCEKLPLQTLEQRVWPLVEAGMHDKQRDVIRRLEDAVGAQKYAAGMQQVWAAAQEGKIETLLVEEDLQCPACVDGAWIKTVPADYTAVPGVSDDAVDQVVKNVMDRGGQIVLFDSGVLKPYDRIAAILRY